MKRSTLTYLFVATAFSIGISSCSKDESDSKQDEINDLKTELITNFSNIAYANYKDAYDDAVELNNSLIAFTDNPTAATHQDAKDAWLHSRESYGQTEAFRFMNGPIDDDNGPEGALNAWPLDENYMDYVYNPITHEIIREGLINDESFDITLANLNSKNEDGGEKNISIGYHAIEFLLWGQDLNASMSGPDFSLSGQRDYTDFTTDEDAERRKIYLKLVGDQLLEDLQYVTTAWAPAAWGRENFESLEDDKAIEAILTGMGKLSKGELAGERMFVALSNKDQEDEHSCFSDNTHRDIYNNALGIRNIYYGTYGSVSGASIEDLVSAQDSDLAAELTALFETTWTKIKAVDAAKPFDKQLTLESVGGSGPIMSAVLSLQEQGDKIAEAGDALGLNVVADLEE